MFSKRLLSAFLIIASLWSVAGCKSRDADDPERGPCLTKCKESWNSCNEACKGDAPLACPAHCDRLQNACKERCEAPPQ